MAWFGFTSVQRFEWGPPEVIGRGLGQGLVSVPAWVVLAWVGSVTAVAALLLVRRARRGRRQ